MGAIVKFFLLMILANIYGCSSTATQKESQDLKNIDEIDFAVSSALNYSQSTDYIDGKSSAEYVAFASETFIEGEIIDNKNLELANIRKECKGNSENEMKEILLKHSNKYRKIPVFWNTIGNCYLMNGDELKAILFYNKANDLSSNYSPALNNLGVIYLRRGDSEKALVAFKKAYKENRRSNVVGYNLASLYVQYGLLEKAHEIIYPIHEIHPQDRLIGSLLVATYKGMDKKNELSLLCNKMKNWYNDDKNLEVNCKDYK